MATAKKDKSAEMFQMPNLDMSKMSENYREYTEKALAQSKESYAKLKGSSEEATKAIEATLENAQAGSVELSLKAISAVRASADNSLSHMEALLGVKSMAELLELQGTFFRKQSELMVDQAKTLQETARTVAEKVSKPAKAVTEKVVAEVEKTVAEVGKTVKAG